MKKKAVSLLLLFALSCAGTQARTHVLWPAVKGAWPPVKSDIEYGLEGRDVATEVEAGLNQMDGAVEADNYLLVRGVPWFALEPLARSGIQRRIDRGDISPGVAQSYLTRLGEFDEAIKELQAR